MDSLFAPWRIEWVARDRPFDEADGCIFCAFIEGDDDREDLVVARGDGAYVVLNNYPYNPGHVMVVPHEHTGRFQDLHGDALRGLETLTQRAIEALEAAYAPDGFNTGCNLGDAAGGSIGAHLHRHVVPRWTGDTNFMAVVDDTKVIVQALADTYDALHDAFADQPGTTADAPDRAVRVR